MGMLQVSAVAAALSNGFSDSEIANAHGVTQSAVSQFIESHGLEQHRKGLQKFEKIDDLYNNLELMAAEKLEKSLKLAVLDPLKLCAVIRTINGAKRRSLSEGNTTVSLTQNRLISLNLPQHVKVRAMLNSQSEVVEIDGRTIATMEAAKIENMSQVQLGGNRDGNTLQELL